VGNNEPYQEQRSPRLSKKPTLYDPQKGHLAVTNKEIDQLTTSINLLETELEPTPKGFVYKAVNPDTGELNEYSKLAKSSDGPLWITAMCNEIGCLFQEYFPPTGKQIQGTDTCRFIKNSELPN
jgi:hypothetical protein